MDSQTRAKSGSIPEEQLASLLIVPVGATVMTEEFLTGRAPKIFKAEFSHSGYGPSLSANSADASQALARIAEPIFLASSIAS